MAATIAIGSPFLAAIALLFSLQMDRMRICSTVQRKQHLILLYYRYSTNMHRYVIEYEDSESAIQFNCKLVRDIAKRI